MHTDVYDEFVELFAKEMSALVVGDPMEEGTDVGPLATEQGREDVEALVKDAVDKGAKVLRRRRAARTATAGGTRRRCSPDITEEMDMYLEEVFGPVAQVYRAERHRGRGPDRQRHPVRARLQRLDQRRRRSRSSSSATSQAGQTFINGMVASFPALPFGGVKASGHGRELAAHGIREFTNIKTVWVGK